MDKKKLAAAVLSSAIALASFSAVAADAATDNQVKCGGIAMKGQNDCKTAAHDCKGNATNDKDPSDFKLVSDADTCVKDGGQVISN
jgi:uncharacterized membrane protein